MRRNERLHGLYNVTAIHLKGVGRIVVAIAEDCFDKQVRKPIQDEFVFRIVDDAASGYESGAKYALVPFLKLTEAGNDILWGIRSVGHNDDDGIATDLIDAMTDRHTETVAARLLDRTDRGEGDGQLGHDVEGVVSAAVIYHDYFVLDSLNS